MNLDNLNLVELNAQEVQVVEGGCPICIAQQFWGEYGGHITSFLSGLTGIY